MTESALKTAHRSMWALGDYGAVADEIIPALGQVLVQACQVGPGQRVLDVAAGTGNAAIPAALAGATVTAADLTPQLLRAGEQHARAVRAEVTWHEADAEALPYGDASFDSVLSCVGVMFAPDHAASAAEMLRVCRPGGAIGLINWTPEGFIGEMFTAMKPYAAPAPPGVQSPLLWGREDHVRTLFGNAVAGLSAQRRTVRINHFAKPEDFPDYFKANYGPTVATYRRTADDPGRTAALDAELADLARRHQQPDGSMEWEYLLIVAARTGT